MPEDKQPTTTVDTVETTKTEPTDVVNTNIPEVPKEEVKSEVTLEDWQQRLLDEQSELEERIRKASNFVVTLDRDSIDYRQLQNQISAMREYYQALGLRVERLVLQQ